MPARGGTVPQHVVTPWIPQPLRLKRRVLHQFSAPVFRVSNERKFAWRAKTHTVSSFASIVSIENRVSRDQAQDARESKNVQYHATIVLQIDVSSINKVPSIDDRSGIEYKTEY